MDFVRLRRTEYSRLDDEGQVYMDYTGSGLYSKWQLDQHFKYLKDHVLGNPHSFSPSSLLSTYQIEIAKEKIMDFFNADKSEYEVIFTQNATGALKLVGESYPFRRHSRFILTEDNHNSINGIREFALKKEAKVVYIPLNLDFKMEVLEPYLSPKSFKTGGLFAYPAQSNFTGARYPLEWVDVAQSMGFDVLLDAAAFVPTNRLDLGVAQPEFVPISFYKMFGYPTGVGALLVKRKALRKLRRPWFSGGTIDVVTTKTTSHHLIEGPQGFEDGTPNFLNIPAVTIGFLFLERVGIDNIHNHVQKLSFLLLKKLRTLRHRNGAPMVVIYGPSNQEVVGSAISFNIKTPSGKVIDSRIIGRLTSENKISVRTGCFCNPGSGENYFGYSRENEEMCIGNLTKEKLNAESFSRCMGGSVNGAVRASLGIASNEDDLNRLITVLSSLKDCSNDLNDRQTLPNLSC